MSCRKERFITFRKKEQEERWIRWGAEVNVFIWRRSSDCGHYEPEEIRELKVGEVRQTGGARCVDKGSRRSNIK